jgi:hypothetical protein
MRQVWVEKRFSTKHTISSEDFNTAGRTIKTGLTASNVVSMWTWAATLLQSSNVAWQYGGESSTSLSLLYCISNCDLRQCVMRTPSLKCCTAYVCTPAAC